MTNWEYYFGTPEIASIMAVRNNEFDPVKVEMMYEDGWFVDVAEFANSDEYRLWLESEVEHDEEADHG